MRNLDLKAQMIKKHGSQWKFAQALGEPESIVSKVICGKMQIAPERRQAWADALGVRVDQIFGGNSND